MLYAFLDLVFFGAKFLIAVLMLLLLLAGILALLAKKRQKSDGTLQITDLNGRYADVKNALLEYTLPKKTFRIQQKNRKKDLKQTEKSGDNRPSVFVLNFNGDIRASAVQALREEITAVLSVAAARDEVVLRLESAGGMVHAYGLAAAQLQRLREKGIRLTVIVDKVAASGGYMMACIADHLIAAPFAIIGSIGVILQLPNFHRLLKDQHIDFEQITAGRYKRTLTVFGENTEEGRQKSREEIEAIHTLFRNLVQKFRNRADMERVTTGEHWCGTEALSLSLVDSLGTSDDYLFALTETKQLFEVRWHPPRSFIEKLTGSAMKLMSSVQHTSLPW